MRRFHLQRYSTRNDRHREREPELSAHPCDIVPALRDRTRGHTFPRSRAIAVASHAAKPAIWDRRLRWFDSRKTDRFESVPGRADLGMRTHPSTDRDHNGQRLNRSRYDAFVSSAMTEDLCEARFHSQHDLSKTRVVFSNSLPGLRCAPRRPEQ